MQWGNECDCLQPVNIFLLDEELRKKYDLYGEEGLKDDHFSNSYQSWDYYNKEFGIYDDDPEIVTLSHSDFGEFHFKVLLILLFIYFTLEICLIHVYICSIFYVNRNGAVTTMQCRWCPIPKENFNWKIT